MNPEPAGRWADHAACRGDTTSMMLPEKAGRWGPTRRTSLAVIKARCLSCPVYDDCRRWALGMPDPAVGMVAAGMTPQERRAARP